LLLLEQVGQEEQVIAMAAKVVFIPLFRQEADMAVLQLVLAIAAAAAAVVAPIRTAAVAQEPLIRDIREALELAQQQLNGIARFFQAGPNASLALVALVVEAALHKLVPMALLGLTGQAAQAAMASIALPLADT
jgi:hypothetical protein